MEANTPTTKSDATKADTKKPSVEKLGTSALVERIKAQSPKLSENVSDKHIAEVARQTLRALAAEVNERDKGRLAIRGLGRLTIKETQRERNGETRKIKRVSLRPLKLKPSTKA